MKIIAVVVLLVGTAACDRSQQNDAAKQTGKAAYHVTKETEKAAKVIGKKMEEAAKEAHQGWKEASREDKAKH